MNVENKLDFELLFSILDYCTVQIKRHRFSIKTDSGIFLFNHIFTRIIRCFFEEIFVKYEYDNFDNDQNQ